MAVQDSCVSAMHTIHEPNKQVFVNLTQPKELASSETELLIRVRKPYTISKQREKWTEEEHEKFLEAIKLHGRSWCRIQEHVGTKTTIQIRSHAQKFFSKVDREINTGNSIGIPPPRPKRKPLHPYPRKLGQLYTIQIPDRKQLEKSSPIPSFSEQESGSPISVLSVVGSDASGSSFIKPPNGSISPSSSFAGSDRLNVSLSESENGYCTPTSSNVGDNKILSLGLVPNTSTKLDESALELRLDSKDHTPPSEGSLVEAQPTSVKLFGRTLYITNSQKTRPFDDENIATQCLKPVPSAEVCPHEEKTEQSPAHEALCGVPSRISCNGAASSIYYLLVPNDVQMGSKSEMFAPVPFLTSFQGILPFTSTNINMTSGHYKHQTRIGDPIQFSPKEDSSSGSNSCSSSNNIIINDDNNHSAVSHEGSGLQHEPLCSFKLKRSENSAFSRVKKASTGRSARGFSPYRRNGDS